MDFQPSEGMRGYFNLGGEGVVKRSFPALRVSFHTEKTCYQASMTFSNKEDDPTGDILSVNTNKNLDAPAGTFSIELIGSKWLTLLTPNDIVVIEMGEHISATKAQMGVVMVGLIDTISRSRSASGDQVNVRVQGRDFGKLFVKSTLRFYPQLGWDKKESEKFFLTTNGWLALMKVFTADSLIKGTPAKILDSIMRYIIQKIVDVKWTIYKDNSPSSPKTVGFSNVVRYQFEHTPFFLPFMLTAQQYEGAIWNLMERCSIQPFTEAFIDVRPVSQLDGTGKYQVISGTIEEHSGNKDKATVVQPDNLGTMTVNGVGVNIRSGAGLNNKVLRKAKKGDKYTVHEKSKGWFKISKNAQEWIYYDSSYIGFTPSKATSSTEGAYTSDSVTFGYEEPSKVCIFLRQTPFEPTAWGKLAQHTVDIAEIVDEEISRSDNEHYNLFWAGSTVSPFSELDLRAEAPPLINEVDIKRYGLSPLEVNIEGMYSADADPDKDTVKITTSMKELTARLKLWYEKNHKYYSGSVTVMGRQKYRVGERLVLPVLYEEGSEFYIEGVSHNFTVFSGWTTNIEITRGRKNGDKTDPYSSLFPPPPPPPKKESPKTEDDYYTVKKGDTLWAIAKSYYGNGAKWTKIWEANKDMLIARDKRNKTDHGHWIYPNQKLRIPK